MDKEINYSGVIRRILAYLIDCIIMFGIGVTSTFIILLSVFFLPIDFTQFGISFLRIMRDNAVIINISLLFMSIIFYTLVTLKFGGGPGQLLLGMRVMDKSTLGKITLMQAIKRTITFQALYSVIYSLVFFVSGWFFVLSIFILLLAVRDEYKQALHDTIANTVVINYRSSYIEQESDSVS